TRGHPKQDQPKQDEQGGGGSAGRVLPDPLPPPAPPAGRLGGRQRPAGPGRFGRQGRGVYVAAVTRRNDGHQLYLTLGSRTAYPTSASMFPTTVASVATSVNPSRTW